MTHLQIQRFDELKVCVELHELIIKAATVSIPTTVLWRQKTDA
jgi:hypothetical protein